MTSALRIQLLGEFSLVLDGRRLTAVSTAREQSLLAYLLLHRLAPQSRRYLAFTLWPDSSEGQARVNLRNLLHRLRQTLPHAEDFLAADVSTIQWRPDAPCSLDVAEFEEACAAGRLQEALDQYGGDLLPGCYEDWIQPERERLHSLFVATAERYVGQLEDRRDYGAALACVQRLLRDDPLREETHRSLIRLHALNGDRAAALRAYHACATLLQRELEVEPDPATRDLYERLVKISPSAGATAATLLPLAGALPLVGRGPEWARLLQAWHVSASGKPQLLVISGEAGIGKTRLAEELLIWAGRQGIHAAIAQCYAAEGGLAYAPVVAWLRARQPATLDAMCRTEVARLLPELLEQSPGLPPPGPLVEAWQRQRFHEALARAVLAGGQPLLLFVDDLQWCDRDTLEWLRYLLRPNGHVPLLVLGTLRVEEFADEHPLSALLPVLRQSGQLVEIGLGPLDDHATTELGERVAGHRLGPEATERLQRETEGSPLLVVEFMRAGLAEAPLPPAGQQGLARLPARVQAVMSARLALLSPAARDLMNLAATIGRDFNFAVLKNASKAEEADLVGWLDELWRRRIVREQGDEAYDFTHDKLRETAYAGLSAARRRWLHRRVAEALEAVMSRDPEAASAGIAAHYDEAGLVDQAIAHYRRAAAASLRVYANQNAIAFLRRALALIGALPSDEQRRAVVVELHETLGDVLHLIGQYDAAREDYQAAVELAASGDLLRRARLYRKIGSTWVSGLRFDEARQAHALAEAALGPAPDEPPVSRGAAPVGSATADLASPSARWWQAWAQIQTDLMHTLYWLNQTDEMDRLCEKTRPVVERYGMPIERAGFFHALVNLDLRRYRFVLPAESVARAKAYLAAQQELDDPAALASARFTVGFALLWHGNLDDAAAALQSALDLAERIGHVTAQVRCLTYLTVLERKRGRVEEAAPLAVRSLDLATASHLLQYVATGRANQAWLAWRAGDLAGVEDNGRAALGLWRSFETPSPLHWLALWPLTAIALLHADLPAAVDHARALLDPSQQLLPDALAAQTACAVQSWDHGHPADAAGHFRQALELAQSLNYL